MTLVVLSCAAVCWCSVLLVMTMIVAAKCVTVLMSLIHVLLMVVRLDV